MSADCQWFVVPRDGNTNEVIADYLNSLNESRGAEFSFVDSKSISRDGWRVRYAVITKLQADAKKFNLKFFVFSKEGGGEFKENTLHLQKKKKAKVKKAEADLKKIQENKKADK